MTSYNNDKLFIFLSLSVDKFRVEGPMHPVYYNEFATNGYLNVASPPASAASCNGFLPHWEGRPVLFICSYFGEIFIFVLLLFLLLP